MTPLFCLLLFFCGALAFTVSGLSGGGAGLVLLPILGASLPLVQVPLALTIGTTSSALTRAILFRRDIRWTIVAWFLPAALPFTIAGSLLLTRIDVQYLQLAIGIFLAANLVTALRRRIVVPAARISPWLLVPVGAAAGLLSGMTGAVGLLFNRFYMRLGLRKEEIVATRAANELLLHLLKLVSYIAAGLLTRDALVAGLIVAAAAICAAVSLRGALRRIDESLFRRLSHAAMGLGGLAMLVSSGQTIAQQNGAALGAKLARHGFETTFDWRDRSYALAFGYGKGLRFERTIDHARLPAWVRTHFAAMSGDADRIVYEEIFGLGRHSYEISVYRAGRRFKGEAAA